MTEVLLYLQYESIAAAKNSKLTLLNLTTYFGYYLIWLLTASMIKQECGVVNQCPS
jgi:hypothetical protein